MTYRNRLSAICAVLLFVTTPACTEGDSLISAGTHLVGDAGGAASPPVGVLTAFEPGIRIPSQGGYPSAAPARAVEKITRAAPIRGILRPGDGHAQAQRRSHND